MQGWSWIPNFGISIASPLPGVSTTCLLWHLQMCVCHATCWTWGCGKQRPPELWIRNRAADTMDCPYSQLEVLFAAVQAAQSLPALPALTPLLLQSACKSLFVTETLCENRMSSPRAERQRVSLQWLPLLRDSRNSGPVARFESCCSSYFYQCPVFQLLWKGIETGWVSKTDNREGEWHLHERW